MRWRVSAIHDQLNEGMNEYTDVVITAAGEIE